MTAGISIANHIDRNASCNDIGQSVGCYRTGVYARGMARHWFAVHTDGPTIYDHIVDPGSDFATARICITNSVHCWH